MKKFARLGVVGSALIPTIASVAPLRAETCVPNILGGPMVCAEWVDFSIPPPQHLTHFTVIYDIDPSKPDVILRANNSFYIWSVDATNPELPGDLGTISVDANLPNNYGLLLARPGTPAFSAGARNIQGIQLLPPDGQQSFMIGGSSISGNVFGDILVKATPSGDGGSVYFSANGDVTGTVKARRIQELAIGGSFVGNIIADELNAGSFLTGTGIHISNNLDGVIDVGTTTERRIVINGDISAVSSIRVQELGEPPNPTLFSEPNIELNSNHGNMNGVLFIGNGLPSYYQKIVIHGELKAPGAIQLNDQDIHGLIDLKRGGDGAILGGGVLVRFLTVETAQIRLGSDPNSVFSGKAYFRGLSCSLLPIGVCGLISGEKLNGELAIKEGADGDISFGSITPKGNLTVGGDLGGVIDVGAEVEGSITVEGKVLPEGKIELGRLSNKARLVARKLVEGVIDIQTETGSGTLIDIWTGLSPSASVTVNSHEGTFNANGIIHVGGQTRRGSLPSVVFDGSIEIKRGAAGGGELVGNIEVVGCHATNADLDICICSLPSPGKVMLFQDLCPMRVDWECVSGCD